MEKCVLPFTGRGKKMKWTMNSQKTIHTQKESKVQKVHTPKMLERASRMTRISFASLALSSEHSGPRQFCSRQ